MSGRVSSGSPTSWLGPLYSLAFGCFLGLVILKFGNPVILDHKIDPPRDLADAWKEPWPIKWAYPLLGVLILGGLPILRPKERLRRCRVPRLLLAMPAVWLGWQFVSATFTVDRELTGVTLIHFTASVTCLYLAFFALGGRERRHYLWFGILAGLAICLIRGVNQRFEFPQDYSALVEGERNGWTNFPPREVLSLKRSGLIINTNGTDIANPVILAKLAKGRINGTLVYPNALAGQILLLFPITLTLAFSATRRLYPLTRCLVIGLSAFLGLGCFFWTGSKAGWLVGLGVLGFWLIHRPWSRRAKWLVTLAAVLLGATAFFARFQGYLSKGATSAAARFDYWRAAWETARSNPVFGTGPGTFQRPYAKLKAPDAEMARLAHNDYLEQASDSGWPGCLMYLGWVAVLLLWLYRLVRTDAESFAVFLGLLGWFAHGFFEFGLYIPALAWTAFTLVGWLWANEIK